MKTYRNTMLIILLVFAGNVLLHPFSYSTPYNQPDSKSRELSFSAASYVFGDVEVAISCIMPNTSANMVAHGKNSSYSGGSLHYMLYHSPLRNSILSNAFFRDFSIKNSSLFFNSGWYHVFALKKIII